MVPCEGLLTRNTHMQYESPISCSNMVMVMVKVFVHASHAVADADAYGRAMTLAPRTYVPAS